MDEYLENVIVSNDYPVVISKFITDAKEVILANDKGELKRVDVSEHVEDAGVHLMMLLLFYHQEILMKPLVI